MNYNNYFPASYQPFYPQQFQYQQQMQQAQQQAQAVQPQQQPVQQQPQQMFTPPMIHAEIVQVASRGEVDSFPVGVGQSQMMILKDESAIFIKSAFANGQSTIEEYVRKPKTATPTADGFITREEFEQRLAELTVAKKVAPAQRKEKIAE